MLIVLVLFCNSELLKAGSPTVGLITHTAGSTDNGYILFAPMSDTTTYLIDKCGYVVHKWVGRYVPGLSVYFLPNGKLLKAGVDKESPYHNAGGGGIMEITDWDGKVEWHYKLSTPTECQHHDFKYMPNGNILVVAWEKKTFEEIKTAGRNPQNYKKEFWSEKVQEIKPIGKDSAEIVWEWKVWDHLVQDFDSTKENFSSVAAHPELIDINHFSEVQLVDWLHINSIDYNPKLDQILLSSRHFNEIWIIDHSTTTEEAAKHEGGKYKQGGDLLYRWGNPQAYRYGTADNKQLYYQHDANWISEGYPYAGNIIVFNNLRGPNTGKYSSVDIIKPPVNNQGFYSKEQLPFGPNEREWSYSAIVPTDLSAINLSSAQILKNGNIIICDGPEGTFLEVSPEKNKVWEYINPMTSSGSIPQGIKPAMTNPVFRCQFFYDDFSGFEGKELLRNGIIENNNINSDVCTLFTSIESKPDVRQVDLYPNPVENELNLNTDMKDYIIEIYDITGEKRIVEENMSQINTSGLENGLYYIGGEIL